MSSSQPKITSAKCPKCKQGFKFKRLPDMAAIVCPHCSAKIRLTRKKSSTGSPEPPRSSPQTKSKQPEAAPKKDRPPRLPLPELSTDKTKAPNASEIEPQVDDFANLNTPRKRQPANLNDLQVGDSSAPGLGELGEDESFPEINPRRKKSRIDFDQLGEIDSEPASLADLEPERRSQKSLASPESGRS